MPRFTGEMPRFDHIVNVAQNYFIFELFSEDMGTCHSCASHELTNSPTDDHVHEVGQDDVVCGGLSLYSQCIRFAFCLLLSFFCVWRNLRNSVKRRISLFAVCVRMWFCAKVAHFDPRSRIDFWISRNARESPKWRILTFSKVYVVKCNLFFLKKSQNFQKVNSPWNVQKCNKKVDI